MRFFELRSCSCQAITDRARLHQAGWLPADPDLDVSACIPGDAVHMKVLWRSQLLNEQSCPSHLYACISITIWTVQTLDDYSRILFPLLQVIAEISWRSQPEGPEPAGVANHDDLQTSQAMAAEGPSSLDHPSSLTASVDASTEQAASGSKSMRSEPSAGAQPLPQQSLPANGAADDRHRQEPAQLQQPSAEGQAEGAVQSEHMGPGRGRLLEADLQLAGAAASMLRDERVLAVPTDTLYGEASPAVCLL